MIIKYISELLCDHECVIVPEFGAFITKECPATLDYATQRLMPPSKELAFNGQLVTDDGLLIGYVAEKLGVTTTVAAKMVHDFANQCLNVIEASGMLRLDGLGVLSRVNSRDYVLQIDGSLNLFGDAFGLPILKIQPVYRRETYQRLAEKIATEQKTKNTLMTVHEETPVEKPHHVNRYNYKWFRAAAYSMMIAMVLVLLGWGADKKDSTFASWNPFFYSSPNEFIAKHFGEVYNIRETVTVDILESLKASIIDCNCDVKYIQPVSPEQLKPVNYEQQKPADTRVYYIIGSSLTNENDAQRCVSQFKKQGFDDAMALPMNEKGNIRIVYETATGYDAALKRLEIIKKDYNEAAWLLRKK